MRCSTCPGARRGIEESRERGAPKRLYPIEMMELALPLPLAARPHAEPTMSERALHAALREHHASLCRSARQLCGNASDADDLVHDVYERALRTEERASSHGNLRAYLHSILRNLFVDRCRRARARPRPMALDEVELPCPSAAADAWWQDISADDVAAAIAELPAEARVVFELHAFEHLRYQDIAARLHIAPATVGTRLVRARAKVRRILEKRASA